MLLRCFFEATVAARRAKACRQQGCATPRGKACCVLSKLLPCSSCASVSKAHTNDALQRLDDMQNQAFDAAKGAQGSAAQPACRSACGRTSHACCVCSSTARRPRHLTVMTVPNHRRHRVCHPAPRCGLPRGDGALARGPARRAARCLSCHHRAVAQPRCCCRRR